MSIGDGAAEQVEHRVQRPTDEDQVTVTATREHLASTRDQLVEEPQIR
jgi:hypothetical protein